MDPETKIYFNILRKNQKLFDVILANRINREDRQTIALCFAEIYINSRHIIKLIEKISKTNIDISEKKLDSLLESLCFSRVEIYNELVDWAKDLKKPLNKAINSVDANGRSDN